MSRFLAPIHTWLFNKIRLHELLEKDLVKAYTEGFGDNILTIAKAMEDKYGAPLQDKPIEELIDTSNIHGWLQNRISIAETRVAAFVSEICSQYGNDAVDIAVDIYAKQGSNCGKDAATQFDVRTAPAIHKALNNYILDGMPCDFVNSTTINEDEALQWQSEKCLHRGYWEAAGADISLLYKLRANWIKAFVEDSNKNFTYTLSFVGINGNTCLVHDIIRK